MTTSALSLEAREVFDHAYLNAYSERRPIGWDDEGQAHHEATQEAVEAVVVFVIDKTRQGGLSVAAAATPASSVTRIDRARSAAGR